MLAHLLAVAGVIALVACSTNDDVPAPSISAAMPNHGLPGTFVTVSGSALCQQPRGSGDDDPLACANMGTLMFDATPATVVAYTDTVVMAEVPALPAGQTSVAVAVAGRTSNSLGFVVE